MDWSRTGRLVSLNGLGGFISAWLAALLLVLGWGALGMEVLAAGAPPSALRVVTFNVFFRNTNLVSLSDFLRSMKADVLALQETTPRMEEQFRRELKGVLPHQHYVTARGSGGCGVLSRFPLESLRDLAPTGAYRGAIIGQVRMSPTRAIPFGIVHLVTPKVGKVNSLASALQVFRAAGEGQDEEIRRIHEAVVAKGSGLGIILGDFNSFSFSPAQQFLKERGWVDSLLSVDAEADRKITWKGSKQTGSLGGRIDYIFHEAGLKTVESRVMDGGGSDHSPVFSRLEFVEGAGRAGGQK